MPSVSYHPWIPELKFMGGVAFSRNICTTVAFAGRYHINSRCRPNHWRTSVVMKKTFPTFLLWHLEHCDSHGTFYPVWVLLLTWHVRIGCIISALSKAVNLHSPRQLVTPQPDKTFGGFSIECANHFDTQSGFCHFGPLKCCWLSILLQTYFQKYTFVHFSLQSQRKLFPTSVCLFFRWMVKVRHLITKCQSDRIILPLTSKKLILD